MQPFQLVGGAGLDIQDRITAPAQVPGYSTGYEEAALEHAYWQMGLSEQYHDYLDDVVNEETALKYSAIWACVRWISQTIASLCFNVFEREDKKRKQIDFQADPIAWMLQMEASPEMSSFCWREVMCKDALTCGNGYSEIEKDGFGRIGAMWYLDDDRVSPDRTSGGNLIYEVKNGSGMKNSILRPDQVFHLKGLTDDGLVGFSVINMARQSIKSGRAQDKFGYDFFSRGPTPAGVFSTPQKLGVKEEEQARKSFDALYSGRKNVGRVIRLTGGATFTPLSLPNNDAQWIEGRTFNLEEICRWFGVPPHKIADLSKSTNNNIEQQSIEAVQDCLWPWCRRFETEANIKLFGRTTRGKRFARLDLQEILRGDSVAQSESLGKQVVSAIRTPNEARDILDLDPDPDGDQLMIQGAMVTLERAASDQQPVAPQQPGTASPQPSTEPGQQQPAPNKQAAASIKQATKRLLSDLYADSLRIEKDKANRAANKSALPEHIAAFYDGHQRWLGERLLPIFTVAVDALGWNDDPKELTQIAVRRHVSASVCGLREFGKTAIEQWSERAEKQAGVDLKEVQL